MSLIETQSRIKARVWQAIAQTHTDLKEIPQEKLDKLVSLVTDAAMMEIDVEIGESLDKDFSETAAEMLASDGEDSEEVLWEGRPFLSISTQYIITNERIRIIEGLLGKDREDIELIRIQDMDQSQSMGERIFNVGDIAIRSHDASHPKVSLRNIKDPQKVHEILRRAVLKAREKYRLHYREEM